MEKVSVEEGARQMVRVRAWQHVINEMLKDRRFLVPVHLAFGYEAVAVALSMASGPEDSVILPHRNAAYQLAFAGDLMPVVEEYSGSPAGWAAGCLGSMNLAGKGSRIVYTTSILGNGVPVAAGFALNKKFQSRPGVTYVVLGDGAMEEGAFYESLVFSSSHRLRLVIIIENNDQSMSSTIRERRTPIDLRQFAGSLGVGYMRVDGARFEQCLEGLVAAGAMTAEKPVVVEVDLYAFNQHAGPTPGWPTDPKKILLSDGAVVQPQDRDPVFHSDSIPDQEKDSLFLAAVAEARKQTEKSSDKP